MAARTGAQNGWNEWSNVVLKELDRLNDNYVEIDNKMDFIKTELTKVKAVWNSIEEFRVWKKSIEDKAIVQKVEDLNKWKDNMDEVWSVTQMKETKDKVDKQTTNWVILLTVWGVIQFLLGIVWVFKDKIFGT